MTMNYSPWGQMGQKWWGGTNTDLIPNLEASDEGRQVLFGGGLSRFGLQGNQYDQAFKLYQPAFSKFLGYTENQLNSGAPNPSFTDFLNNNFDIRREMNKQPQMGRRTAPLRYF